MRSESGSWLCPLCMADSGFINQDNAAIWLADHFFDWHGEKYFLDKVQREHVTCPCCKHSSENRHWFTMHINQPLDLWSSKVQAKLLGITPEKPT
jgi:hypothetical protein